MIIERHFKALRANRLVYFKVVLLEKEMYLLFDFMHDKGFQLMKIRPRSFNKALLQDEDCFYILSEELQDFFEIMDERYAKEVIIKYPQLPSSNTSGDSQILKQ